MDCYAVGWNCGVVWCGGLKGNSRGGGAVVLGNSLPSARVVSPGECCSACRDVLKIEGSLGGVVVNVDVVQGWGGWGSSARVLV